MASHQQRRDPLPADYQYPTHGVDCDCPPCRNRVVETQQAACPHLHLGMYDARTDMYLCQDCNTLVWQIPTGFYDKPKFVSGVSLKWGAS